MDTATIPYAWQTMQHLHARIEQHAEAIGRDLTEAVQALETHRQQAGLTKVFLSSPVVRSRYAACPSAAHKVSKVISRDRVYAVTAAEPFPTEEEARQLWQEERRALRP